MVKVLKVSSVKLKKEPWIAVRSSLNWKTFMRPSCQVGLCIVWAFVWELCFRHGVSEPARTFHISDEGCTKYNGTVFYVMLKLTFSMFYQKSNRWLLQVLNLCACICFSFCVYWRTHTSACTKLSRDFLQAKLNCEINACFVLNELCDLYFYCKILALKLSSVKLKKN